MAKKKPTIQTLKFEDLTIAEILHYFNHSFCGARFRYLKYGKNLRAAYDELIETGEFATVADTLELNLSASKVLTALEKAAEPLVKNKDHLRDFKNFLHEQWDNGDLDEGWFKDIPPTKEERDVQYANFVEALKKRLRKNMEQQEAWGVRLAKDPPTPKEAK